MPLIFSLLRPAAGLNRRLWLTYWLFGALVLLLPGLAFAGSRPSADSLRRLLAFVRRADEFQVRHRPDSVAHYLGQA